jgi:hypothetical protein
VATETAEYESHRTAESHAKHQHERFQESFTGAGVTLSRLTTSRPLSEDSSPIAGFLTERRDTQDPMAVDAAARRTTNYTVTSRVRVNAIDRWENEGGTVQ